MKEADQIISALNTLSLDTDELAKAIASVHPTLQQDFMRVCMKFIKVEAEKTEDQYDPFATKQQSK
jgi:hypothetical protein